MSNGYAPGAVLWVQGPDWLYVRSAGKVAAGGDRLLNCVSPYEAGSSTKMLTAAVLLQLHESGALSIDDRLAKYPPEAAGAIPNGEIITLRQLANHTAGVFSYTDDAPDGTPGLMAKGANDAAALSRGCEDLNDAMRVSADPTFRLRGSKKNWDCGGALTSRLPSFQTGMPAGDGNLIGLMAVNRELIAQAEAAHHSDRGVLDMDSTEGPIHGQQEGSAYNGHFESVCYHPLLLFNQHGDCLSAKLRPGNVSSAEDGDELLLPEIGRRADRRTRVRGPIQKQQLAREIACFGIGVSLGSSYAQQK